MKNFALSDEISSALAVMREELKACTALADAGGGAFGIVAGSCNSGCGGTCSGSCSGSCSGNCSGDCSGTCYGCTGAACVMQ